MLRDKVLDISVSYDELPTASQSNNSYRYPIASTPITDITIRIRACINIEDFDDCQDSILNEKIADKLTEVVGLLTFGMEYEELE